MSHDHVARPSRTISRLLQKEMKLLVKQVTRPHHMTVSPDLQARGWDVYVGMAKSLDDMAVALPLVGDLRDEAVKERHWKKLVPSTWAWNPPP